MNKKRATDELGRVSLEEYQGAEKLPVVVVLDDIRSLSNVGSIFRTCDAFRVKEIVLCGITGRPPHRDIQRTALGATESVSWRYEEDVLSTIERLKSDGYQIASIEQCERSISPEKLEGAGNPVCLVLGNEVNGVAQEVIDVSNQVIEIPQEGTKHSFNVTVAGGIVLWEVFKKWRGA